MTGAWLQTPTIVWSPRTRTTSKRSLKLGWMALVAAASAHGLVFFTLLPSVDGAQPKPVSAPLMVSLVAPATELLPVQYSKPQPKVKTAKPKVTPVATLQPAAKEALSEPVASAAQTSERKSPETETQPVVAARFDADYLNNPAPKYPPLARRLKEQGVVLVRVHVQPSGDPAAVELKQSSGSERLDQAALTVVKQWRFVPAKQGSDAIAAWVVVPISFSLGA